MGKGSSKPLQSIDLSLNHPRFTNAKFVSDEKQRRMQTTMGVDNKVFDKWHQWLSKSKPASEYLLLPVKQDFSSKGLCGSSGTLTLDFQQFPYLLTQQIAHRRGKKRLFEQNELWYLLFSLLSAKKDMKPDFSKIGDVRPQNIFINEKSQIKVANLFSWPNQQTNFMKAIQNQVTYLAPQQLKQLERGEPQGQKNDQSQLFSIGLTLLSAAALDDFTNAYDLKKFSLNTYRITQKLNQFKLNRAYSDIFKAVVCNLCQFNQQSRILTQELWNWILPHEQKIKTKQNFFIPSAPEKIHQQVQAVRHFVSQIIGSTFPGGDVVSSVRPGSFSGQKLNFPPPTIKTTTVVEGDPLTKPFTFAGTFSNPLVYNAQSTYIPSSKISQGAEGGVSSQGATSTITNVSTNKIAQNTPNFTTQNTTDNTKVDVAGDKKI